MTEEEIKIESAPVAPPFGQAKEFRSAFFDVAPAMFLGTLDQTIIAAALPAITASLGGFSYLAWVVSAYLLAATIAAPIYGRMGDAFGRRKMLVWALALFIAGSLVCALSPNLTVLICARGLQGFGGGGLMTLSQALIGEVVSPKERGRFQGWFGANFALASTLGPVAGGFLSQHLGWRSIFWINIPLGIGAAIAALRLKTSEGTGSCRLDYGGTALFTASTVALLLTLSLGGHEVAWTSPGLLGLAFVAMIGFILLAGVEKRSADPLISPTLIEEPIIWRAVLSVLLFAAVLFGLIVQLPLFLQAMLGASPTVSGLMLIPLTLAQVAVSTATGLRISTTGHPRNAMAVGLTVVTAGFIVLAAGIKLGPFFIIALTFLIGAGLGSTMPAAQTMVQWAAGGKMLGAATAALSFSRTIGGVIGAALTSAVLLGVLQFIDPGFTAGLTNALSSVNSGHLQAVPSSSSLICAFRWMFLTLGVFAGCATLIAWSIPELDLSSSPLEKSSKQVPQV